MSKSKKKSSVRNYLTQKKVFRMKNKNWAKQIEIIVSDLVMSNFCGKSLQCPKPIHTFLQQIKKGK